MDFRHSVTPNQNTIGNWPAFDYSRALGLAFLLCACANQQQLLPCQGDCDPEPTCVYGQCGPSTPCRESAKCMLGHICSSDGFCVREPPTVWLDGPERALANICTRLVLSYTTGELPEITATVEADGIGALYDDDACTQPVDTVRLESCGSYLDCKEQYPLFLVASGDSTVRASAQESTAALLVGVDTAVGPATDIQVTVPHRWEPDVCMPATLTLVEEPRFPRAERYASASATAIDITARLEELKGTTAQWEPTDAVLFTDPDCTVPGDAATLPSGTASRTFYVAAPSAYRLAVRAQAIGLLDGGSSMRMENAVDDPAVVSLLSGPSSAQVGACSPYTVLVMSMPGRLVRIGVIVVARLTTSGGGAFHSDSVCKNAVATATLPADASVMVVYYQSASTETARLEAAIDGLASQPTLLHSVP